MQGFEYQRLSADRRSPSLREPPDRLFVLLAITMRDDGRGQGSPHGFRARPTEHCLGHVIPLSDVPVCPHADEGIIGRLDDESCSLATLPKCLLGPPPLNRARVGGPLLLCDVLYLGEKAWLVSVAEIEAGNGDRGPHVMSVRVDIVFLGVVPATVADEQLSSVRLVGRQVVEMRDRAERKLQELVLCAANELSHRLVDLQEASVTGDQRHPDGRVPERQAKEAQIDAPAGLRLCGAHEPSRKCRWPCLGIVVKTTSRSELTV
jgi:hypothetical protein